MSDLIINYIYLLQEREFVKTSENVYKVGMTEKENHTRFNQYPKGSILLFQTICNNCKKIEKEIIELFKDNFKYRRDIGNEYFEGDYKHMIDIIYLTVKYETNCDDIINKEKITNDDEKTKFNLLCKKISKIFPDYKNDVSFGGNKKYIKISSIGNEYIVYYITPILMDQLQYYYDNDNESETIFNDIIINQYKIHTYVADQLQYFNNLINKKIIYLNKPYDINSNDFITKINKTKFNIIIENYDDVKPHLSSINIDCEIVEKIRQLFHCNILINDELYSTIVKEDDFDNIFKKI